MTRTSRATFFGLVLLACSCAPTSSNDFAPISKGLDQARSRWSEAGITRYRLTVVESRNYWSNGCTWTSVVSNGVVTGTSIASASNSACTKQEWTVEKLHDVVSGMLHDVEEFAAPEFGRHKLDVTFDANGVPEAINFDLANGADEESSMQVTFANEP